MARAKGGTGLIISGGAYVTDTGRFLANTYMIGDDRHISVATITDTDWLGDQQTQPANEKQCRSPSFHFVDIVFAVVVALFHA